MAELKTQPTQASAEDFIGSIADETRREDCRTVMEMMRSATGSEPTMWGPSIVGFGSYRYRYDSGREGDWFLIGFSPRKSDLTLYIMPGVGRYDSVLSRLGKYKTGKSCLYIKRLADVDLTVLGELFTTSVEQMQAIQGRSQ